MADITVPARGSDSLIASRGTIREKWQKLEYRWQIVHKYSCIVVHKLYASSGRRPIHAHWPQLDRSEHLSESVIPHSILRDHCSCIAPSPLFVRDVTHTNTHTCAGCASWTDPNKFPLYLMCLDLSLSAMAATDSSSWVSERWHWLQQLNYTGAVDMEYQQYSSTQTHSQSYYTHSLLSIDGHEQRHKWTQPRKKKKNHVLNTFFFSLLLLLRLYLHICWPSPIDKYIYTDWKFLLLAIKARLLYTTSHSPIPTHHFR